MEIITKQIGEIHISGDEFKKLDHKMFQEIAKNLYDKITFVFERGQATNDEIFDIEKKRVYLSSFAHGIVQWNKEKRQYVKMYYGSKYPIGNLVRIELPYSEELESFLKQ